MNQASDLIVIIGASYVKGWDLKALHGKAVVNKGVNGERSSDMVARFKKDVIAHKPVAVIIWGFINDLFGADRSQINPVMAQARQNFEKMVELSRYNNVRPILATELTIRPTDSWKERLGWVFGLFRGKTSYQAFVNENVWGMNAWMKQYAQANDLLLLDFHAVLSDKRHMRGKKYTAPDGVHISGPGYDRLSEYAREILAPVVF